MSFHEEKMIGGIMNFRTKKDGDFHPYTMSEISERYNSLQNQMKELREMSSGMTDKQANDLSESSDMMEHEDMEMSDHFADKTHMERDNEDFDADDDDGTDYDALDPDDDF